MSRKFPSDDDRTDALPFPSNPGERPLIEEQQRLVTSAVVQVAAATGAAAELGALPTKEERRRQQKPPPMTWEEGVTENSAGASYGGDAPAAPPRTASMICAEDTVLVVEGCGVAEANGAYARTTKTANGQPVYAMAGKWKSKEVHYVVYKQLKVRNDWTLGIHPKRTMTEFKQCAAYYRLYR